MKPKRNTSQKTTLPPNFSINQTTSLVFKASPEHYVKAWIIIFIVIVVFFYASNKALEHSKQPNSIIIPLLAFMLLSIVGAISLVNTFHLDPDYLHVQKSLSSYKRSIAWSDIQSMVIETRIAEGQKYRVLVITTQTGKKIPFQFQANPKNQQRFVEAIVAKEIPIRVHAY